MECCNQLWQVAPRNYSIRTLAVSALSLSMQFFCPENFFQASQVDPRSYEATGMWRVTSKLHEDARRCSKYFQQVWYELEMSKVCAVTTCCAKIPNNIPLSLNYYSYIARVHTHLDFTDDSLLISSL